MIASSGSGEVAGHHGELIQGIFEDDDAQLRRALVSLPCRHLRSKAVFTKNDTGTVSVTPSFSEKARRAAELTLDAFARSGTGGTLVIDSNIPIGRGMGSSTADVLASILAVLDCLGIETSSDEIMQIAVRAETACDSTLFKQQAVLFAQRDGIVLESFLRPLPSIDLISIDTAPDATLNTLEFEPARYDWPEIETFRPLRGLLRLAIRKADLRLLGRVATASARINERFLPKPRLNDIETIAARFDAIGLQVAHSGTVVGLMFDPRDEKTPENIDRAVSELALLDFQPTIFCH
ncbi:MAG: GHMP kinase [Mesorhizobium sp.]|nr:GHMP kinase [Mesorhizobium sp. M5C.F.Ca.IN.020.14.1.1]RWI32032.1 MAG: GHMP kinase [Mesorhizobium sp.]RWI61356.1 MAG: GHMP kinase [Mesorhizobium sp.]RWJ22863.1 MAG: GHMP kinase [Mesorhizobium sp.]TIQ70115.1 MAG: GHMP kinase [Mesorhizobium sp.]